jgi:hypothetical protein
VIAAIEADKLEPPVKKDTAKPDRARVMAFKTELRAICVRIGADRGSGPYLYERIQVLINLIHAMLRTEHLDAGQG